MNNNPLISVIVPVYNKEKYIDKCVESLVNQTYTNLEIFLIDDGSTDNSAAICDEYASKDSRIKSIHRENGGPGAVRNYGVSICNGEYVSFVDSDDWIELDMYESMYNAMVEHGAELAVCGRNMVYEDDGAVVHGFTFDSVQCFEAKDAIKRFLTYGGIDASPCDKLIKKELFKRADISFPSGYICEDVPVVFGLVSSAEKTVHIGKPCYNYLQRRGSYSNTKFSEKALGLKIYPGQVRDKAKEQYPSLAEEADWYYSVNLMTLVTRFEDTSDNRFKELRSELVKYKKVILGKFSSKKQKMLFRLIKYNLFSLVRKLYRKIK